jgi:ribosomal protein S18 acetylase RimI-like enzyme
MPLHDDITIGPPQAGDRAGWEALWAGYCTFYNMPHTPEKADTVWSWITSPNHPVSGFLARDVNGAVLGMTHYRAFHRPLVGGVGCFLDDLFVAPEARGRGTAEALIARVVEEAKANGWGVVRWITAADNTRARALYDRIASRTHWITYEIRP